MIRKISGVFVGYATFVATSLALFKISGVNPHADPTLSFEVFTAAYGIICSFFAGWIAQAIAKSKTLRINYILAIILAGFAAFSLFKTAGNHWTQLLAIFIFAPATIAGGILRIRSTAK